MVAAGAWEEDRKRHLKYWVTAWEKASDYQTRRKIEMWNNRAESYAKNTVKGENSSRQRAVFEFLGSSGVRVTGAKILDVGCGPGNYAVPLAMEAEHVWALEPASRMLEILRKRVSDQGIGNITCINRPWEDIDIEREGWNGKFDLVFASMTPGVNDQETLDKVVRASKGYCYVSKFAGPRRNNLQEKLWQQVFGGIRADTSMDIIYPLNIVYAMGYFPALRFFHTHWVNEESVEDTAQKLKDWISGYTEITSAILREIKAVVDSEAVGGVVREEVEATVGMMVWKV
ncbi:class I SAM-dependent methyltransferase [Phosphitispora fastidiosa]|uniref:class I SAM-dependent methyltransferase n=1 Tax=Phosphitispora fastidiosa TaxID=2837202 RepID=UPI001E4F0D93|nr:class I SAM-dependent methyltransferase [Phosphitispora fastidiosa]MBU7005847.1 ubiquinone/menaquinone biosynthesis C-methylase UbiE [Phosphitispora fastidiosa]